MGIAVGPPLILGAITKLAGRWFPRDERATATGLGTLAIYLGILASLIVTPLLLNSYGMKMMLVCTGIVSAVAAAFLVATVREKPPTPAGPGDQEVRSLMFDGLRSMMKPPPALLFRIAPGFHFQRSGERSQLPISLSLCLEDIEENRLKLNHKARKPGTPLVNATAAVVYWA